MSDIDTAALRAEMNRDNGLSVDVDWLAGWVLPDALDEIDRLRAELDELGVDRDFWRFRATNAESRLGICERRLATAEMHLREHSRGEGHR